MAKYTVPLTSWANIAVDVEVPDDATPQDIVDAAMDAASPSLCHQCNGGRNDSLEIGDDSARTGRQAGARTSRRLAWRANHQPEIESSS